MGFKLTRKAERDVVNIYLYGYAEFGAAQAESYQGGLFAAIAFLAENPMAARERREFRRPVRCFPYRSHVIVYTAGKDAILIIRVLHGHQDPGRHL